MTDLASTPWPAVSRGGTVVVPVGSLEQHGPHLPLDTDAVIAVAVAQRVAASLGGTTAPVVAYGASGEHQAFPGTVSMGAEALRFVLVELVRSLHTWAGRVVLVNGHGGNAETVAGAVEQLRAEGHDVAWAPCSWVASGGIGDSHAGFSETSLMLHLDPARVRPEVAEAGNTAPLPELLPAMRVGGIAAVSPNGVLGDPGGATAAEGAWILDAMVAGALDRLAVRA